MEGFTLLSKVPTHIQVRIISPSPQDSVPHTFYQEEIPSVENPILKAFKKIFSSVGVSTLIAVVLFSVVRSSGLDIGSAETSIIVLFPSFFGLIASFVVF